jgi:energy-coupling factor transporter ATP-binding protein EcfA2
MDAQPPVLAGIVRYVCEESLMFADERSPFQAKAFYPKETRVCVIVGENASGKSVFFQVMAGVARREHKLLPVTISIRERTGAGSHEMGGMRRTMMFGDESEQSTGATSYNVIQSGFHNVSKPNTRPCFCWTSPRSACPTAMRGRSATTLVAKLSQRRLAAQVSWS